MEDTCAGTPLALRGQKRERVKVSMLEHHELISNTLDSISQFLKRNSPVPVSTAEGLHEIQLAFKEAPLVFFPPKEKKQFMAIW